MENIVGLLPDETHMRSAERELRAAGFSDNTMHMLLGTADFWRHLCSKEKTRLVFKDAVIGALVGLVFGCLFGAIVGVLNCRLMDCPVETSMIFHILIALYCAFAGALFGTSIGMDRLERSVLSYVTNLDRDEALFVVEISKETSHQARHILEPFGTVVDLDREEVEQTKEYGLEQ